MHERASSSKSPGSGHLDVTQGSGHLDATHVKSRSMDSGEGTGGKMAEAMRRRSSMANRPVNTVGDVEMAGPMVDLDVLHFINFGVALGTLTLAAGGLFWPSWFYGFKQSEHISGLTADGRARSYHSTSLFSIVACEDFLDRPGDLSITPICHGTVTASQRASVTGLMNADSAAVKLAKIAGCIGLAFISINVILQLVGFFLKPRIPALTTASLGVCVIAGFTLMLGGMAGNHVGIYGRQERSRVDGRLLVVNTMGAGMMLMCVVGCAVNGVFLHVVSHGPGPLTTNTRFLYPLGRPTMQFGAAELGEEAARALFEEPPEILDPEASTAV